MNRARRALAYHLFAAEPLVMMSAILNADSPRLDALVAFCLKGIEDPGLLAKRTGVAQEAVKPSDYAWLHVYARRHPSPVIAALLSGNSRPFVTRLGGALDSPNPLEHAGRP